MPNIPEIKARYEAATEGRWGHSADFGHHLDIKAWLLIAVSGNSFLSLGRIVRQEDLDFIAHARTDIPQLVTALEEIKDECEGYGEPIGYDRTYALAQKILAILGEKVV